MDGEEVKNEDDGKDAISSFVFEGHLYTAGIEQTRHPFAFTFKERDYSLDDIEGLSMEELRSLEQELRDALELDNDLFVRLPILAMYNLVKTTKLERVIADLNE